MSAGLSIFLGIVLVFILPATLGMKVAIIGGGVSGLACARALSKLCPAPAAVTVFDTGKRSVGGRCSSREVIIEDENIIVDHAAQYIRVNSHSHPSFREFIENNAREGELRAFKTSCIGEIDENFQLSAVAGKHTTCPSSMSMNYAAPQGMGHFTKECLAKDLDSGVIYEDVWINKLVKKGDSTKWNVYGKGKLYGEYDKVVIAHNGKCADRLVSSLSRRVPAIHERLKVNFGPNIKSMRKMHLCSLFVLAFVIPRGSICIDDRFTDQFAFEVKRRANNDDNNDGKRVNSLSWICNTSRKIQTGNEERDRKYESWTLISTKEYAGRNKVPQEAIPPEDEMRISKELISDFQRCLSGGSTVSTNSIMDDLKFSKLQLWGAAIPLNRLNCPFLYDGKEGIGVCGDWFDTCSGVGPSIETAFMSGTYLAQHIIDNDRTDAYLEDNQYCYEAVIGQSSLGDVNVDIDEVSEDREVLKGPMLNPIEFSDKTNSRRPTQQSDKSSVTSGGDRGKGRKRRTGGKNNSGRDDI